MYKGECVCVCVTSVVDVSGDLYVAQLCVDWQGIEVLICLQREFSSQRHRVPLLIVRVDQHGVIIIKLQTHKQRTALY